MAAGCQSQCANMDTIGLPRNTLYNCYLSFQLTEFKMLRQLLSYVPYSLPSSLLLSSQNRTEPNGTSDPQIKDRNSQEDKQLLETFREEEICLRNFQNKKTSKQASLGLMAESFSLVFITPTGVQNAVLAARGDHKASQRYHPCSCVIHTVQ